MRRLWGIMFVMAALLLGGTAFAQVEFYGDWFLQKNLDPITDENSSTMGVLPDEAPSLYRRNPLGIGCSAGPGSADGVMVFLAGAGHVSGSSVPMTYRVDSREPVTVEWRVASPSVAPRDAAGTRALISEMLEGERVVLRYRAYSGTVTFIYPVAGLGEALQELGCYTGEL